MGTGETGRFNQKHVDESLDTTRTPTRTTMIDNAMWSTGRNQSGIVFVCRASYCGLERGNKKKGRPESGQTVDARTVLVQVLAGLILTSASPTLPFPPSESMAWPGLGPAYLATHLQALQALQAQRPYANRPTYCQSGRLSTYEQETHSRAAFRQETTSHLNLGIWQGQ